LFSARHKAALLSESVTKTLTASQLGVFLPGWGNRGNVFVWVWGVRNEVRTGGGAGGIPPPKKERNKSSFFLIHIKDYFSKQGYIISKGTDKKVEKLKVERLKSQKKYPE